jgi:hypothetical protein
MSVFADKGIPATISYDENQLVMLNLTHEFFDAKPRFTSSPNSQKIR